MHSVVVDGLINMLGVPMGLGVMGSLMPIFGDPDPSLFDQVFAQLIGITYGVGYAVMIGHNLGSCYIGNTERDDSHQNDYRGRWNHDLTHANHPVLHPDRHLIGHHPS